MKKLVYLAVVSCFAATLPAGAEDKVEAPAASSRAARAPQWSPYKVLQAPALPAVKQAKWVRKPVDAFVLAQLEGKNIKPSCPHFGATGTVCDVALQNVARPRQASSSNSNNSSKMGLSRVRWLK